MADSENTKPFYNSVIPRDWEIKKLTTLSEKVGSGITPKGGERVYKESGRPFMRSQNVGWGTLILDEIAFIDEETHQSFQSTEIKDGDVFLNITGASIGRSSIATKAVVGGNVNQHVCIIRVKQDELLPAYLNSFLLSTIGQNLIDSFQAGGNRQGLNFEQIKSFKVPLPPLAEQKAIARVLGLVDSAINQNNQLIAQKELRKKWLMQNLLTGKKRLKGFGGEWTLKKLGDVAYEISARNNGSLTSESLMAVTKASGIIPMRERVQGEGVARCKLIERDSFAYNPMRLNIGSIARVLGLMDSVINQNNQLIAQKELRKKWLMQNLLTGKKGLKGFSEDWKEVSLNKLFTRVTRKLDFR